MAPEALDRKSIDEKVDIWSFGLIFWQLFTRERTPYDMKTYMDPLELAYGISIGDRPVIPAGLDKSITDIMQMCWEFKPANRPTFKQIIEMLDNAIYIAIIKEPVLIDMWKNNFGSQETVLISEFLPVFYTTLGENINLNHKADRIKDMCLRALLLSSKDSEMVSLQRFGEVLMWFGPAITETNSFLDRLVKILSKSWFHGDISREEAQCLLQTVTKSGSYLIRTSDKPNYPFTLSMISKGNIKHFRISHVNGIYGISTGKEKKRKDTKMKSLPDLIKSVKDVLNLKHSCVRQKYRDIFGEENLADGGYEALVDDDCEIDISKLANLKI
jgi:serine/threonine protein kinase